MAETGKDWVGQVERGYATALFEVAEENGQLDQVSEQVEALRAVFAEEADLNRLLGTGALSAAQRAEAIDRLFLGKVADSLLHLMQVMNRKGRMALLAGTLDAFHLLKSERANQVRVTAYVAHELPSGQADQMAKKIGAAIDREVLLSQEVDRSLIGGVKLRIGDRLIDGSVSAQLRNMRDQMIDTGRVRARQSAAGG